ncbi:MAG: transcription antitermination factor NusB [Deltaproteobacteria bacterium]|nr:transcription antitermination factor NusB [Deltaproteobacteria bacterium]
MRGSRRQSREATLQILYQLDANPELQPGAAIALFLGELNRGSDDADVSPTAAGTPSSVRKADLDAEWISGRVHGVVAQLATLDEKLSSVSRNWRVDRMSRLDRNILRLALYELSLSEDLPRQVVFNEAIELAKRFGTAEAPAFINGVLESASK